jgi:hypothetical protein
MAELVTDCPRCGAQSITFNVESVHITDLRMYGWQNRYEAFAICRNCQRSTVFVLEQKGDSNYDHVHKVGLLQVHGALNNWVDVKGYINLKDMAAVEPPGHVPDNIAKIFREGATALAVECPNAAGAMYRLCVDLATKALLPAEDAEGPRPNRDQKQKLALRLNWLFDNGKLDAGLKELSVCIKDDGDDAAHNGTLTMKEAEDLLDFTVLLLQRRYTVPKQLERAKARKIERRDKK